MRALAFLLVVILAACNRAPRTGVGDRQVIRAAEIATVTSGNAYDVVAKLRPEFLKSRGPLSASRGRATQLPTSTVFIDGVEAGPINDVLPRIQASEVHEIRMYRSADATTKYGTRHAAGVIEVTTVRQARP
jgi:hypothetical protein